MGSLKDRRKQLGVSQQKLAERAGCSVGTVRLLEGGWRPERGAWTPERFDTLLTEMEGERGQLERLRDAEGEIA